VISLRDLWFSYNGPGRPVLAGFSLHIPAGATTAILGPNGSGKTTLLRLILGVLTPGRGTVELAGRPVASYPRRERSRLVGLVPQDEHIPFSLSAVEYVLLGRAPYLRPLQAPGEEDYTIALAALATVGAAHLADRAVSTLSGGERQLAVIARALAQKPRVLLLDEPTAHLDLGNRGRLLGLLRGLVAEGMDLVLTTHDPNLAAEVADFVVLVGDGRVLDAGPAGEILVPDKLGATYGVPVEVHQLGGRRIVLLS
jgi:iron complex transport system ATP-binding protein